MLNFYFPIIYALKGFKKKVQEYEFIINIAAHKKTIDFRLHRVCSYNGRGIRIVDTLSLLEYCSFEINVKPWIYSELNKFHYFVNNDDNISLEKYAFLFIHSIYLL